MPTRRCADSARDKNTYYSRGGALKAWPLRVDGPLVASFSVHDTAVGKLYPLASLSSPGRRPPDRRAINVSRPDPFEAVQADAEHLARNREST